jgi:gluconokinase
MAGQTGGVSRGPAVLVVMGVSGSGKTTIGTMLADRLGWRYAEGDDFHPEDNVRRMAAGEPLTDDDRWPWLEAIGRWIDDRRAAGESGVVSCSALRQKYRDVLSEGRPEVRIVFLGGSRELIERRLAARRGHFMRAGMLDGQFAALEPPDPDEGAITVSIDATPAEVVDEILGRLQPQLRPRES